jgi:23S rRNA pseudouridine1911/1915/1917 synthase
MQSRRLDICLVERLKENYSRSYVKKLIDSGNVRVNDLSVKAHYSIRPGDKIRIEIPEPEELSVRPEKMGLDILYEDSDVIVINKPAGLVMHPAPGHFSGTLVNGLLEHCKDLSGIGGVLRPGIVHRIDKDTSGVIVVAKNDNAHRFISQQFRKKSIKRVYIALVRGIVQLDNGIIELPIGRSLFNRKKMGVNFSENKQACTQYKVLKRFSDFTMLEVVLKTGRTHQIRVHMAHIGHPIIGDKLYGSSKGMARQALHAKILGFLHPVTKQYMEFDSPLPRDMQEVIDRGKI